MGRATGVGLTSSKSWENLWLDLPDVLLIHHSYYHLLTVQASHNDFKDVIPCNLHFDLRLDSTAWHLCLVKCVPLSAGHRGMGQWGTPGSWRDTPLQRMKLCNSIALAATEMREARLERT